MPSKASKLLERMRQKKTGWKRHDVESLYKGFGFVIKGGGSHDKVTHPDFPELITSLPRHGTIHEYMVIQAIKLIEKLEKLKAESEQSDE